MELGCVGLSVVWGQLTSLEELYQFLPDTRVSAQNWQFFMTVGQHMGQLIAPLMSATVPLA